MAAADLARPGGRTVQGWLLHAFVRIGVLPVLLVVAIVIFALSSDRFLTWPNISNVLRQSSYLTMVSLGQMLVLFTGGFDLSVGTMLAVTSVVSALTMSAAYAAMPEAVWLAILIGMLAGLAAGSLVGAVNGIGVAVFNVSPFIMTLGMASVGFGIALFLTGGTPVRGLPDDYSTVFGFGRLLEIPTPVWITAALVILVYILVNWTRVGRYFYAIGGNLKACVLSGIPTRLYLFLAYLICGVLSTISGLVLTARLETGEANIGQSMPLDSIAACVIAGVSLRGGTGRVEMVVLGALFINIVQNGMNLARVESYLQIVVTGVILIVAVIVDELRRQLVGRLQD